MEDRQKLRQHLFDSVNTLTYPDRDWEDEILDWYRTWRLEDVRVVNDQRSAAFIWRDPADGQRYAWRLQAKGDRSLRDLFDDAADYLFLEDLFGTVASPPDDDGVRWLGVVARDWERFNGDHSLHPRMA